MNLQSDFISPATTNSTSTTNATNNQAPSINISINNGIDSTASYLSGSLISTSKNNKSGANLTNLAANNSNSVSSYHSPLTISSLSSTSSSSSSSSSSPSAYIIPVNAALTSATTTSRPTYITINNLNNTSAINSVQPQQQIQRQQQQQLGTNNQQTTQSQSSSPSSASSPCSSSVSYPSETPSNSSANYCMNSAVGSSSSSSSNNTNPVVGSLNSSSNNSNTANKLLAQQIVELLRRLNIRLVAFDFDYTIVTIHTGGQWLDSPEKLAEFVRPCFRDLLPVLLKTPDLNVCVVTYSPQERLIREVLRISLKDEHDVNDLVNKMVIKGNTKEFLERHGIEQCYANGKQVHIQYCRNHFQQQQQQSKNMVAALPNANNVNKIDAANVLLIDDDIQNIHLASVNGHYAFPVENNMKLPDLYRFLKEQLESYI